MGWLSTECLVVFMDRMGGKSYRTGFGDPIELETIVYFTCGKSCHGVSRCPEMNETFPYMLPGCTAEKVGSSYVMISSQVAAERLRAENGQRSGEGVSHPDQL